MIIRYFGHSFFEIKTDSGKRIVTDPYGDFYNYPKRKIMADICCISHHHSDHDGTSSVCGNPIVIDKSGNHIVDDSIRIISIPVWHDEVQGAKRGSNLIHIIEAEGLRIAHMGDLGHMLTQEMINYIGKVDVMMIPVGGFYTISAYQASMIQTQLLPLVTIPIHYRTEYNPDMPIQPITEWLNITKSLDQQLEFIRINRNDIKEQPQMVTMKIIGA